MKQTHTLSWTCTKRKGQRK